MFITFEGGEGVGKSTNIQSCADWLRERGTHVVITREPGGTDLAEDIRTLIKQPKHEPMHELTELLLVFAARNQHLTQVIEPALKRGQWVLCDRFTDSTVAYQGYGRRLELSHIEQLKHLVQHQREPDMTFLLDAPVEVGMARAHERAQHLPGVRDRFEGEQYEFFERVRQGFHELAKQHDRIHTIDATQPLPRVQSDILGLLEPIWETLCGSH